MPGRGTTKKKGVTTKKPVPTSKNEDTDSCDSEEAEEIFLDIKKYGHIFTHNKRLNSDNDYLKSSMYFFILFLFSGAFLLIPF